MAGLLLDYKSKFSRNGLQIRSSGVTNPSLVGTDCKSVPVGVGYSVANGIIAASLSMFPSYQIPLGSNASLTLSASMVLSPNGLNLAANVLGSVTIGNTSLHGGVSIGSSSATGAFTRYSIGAKVKFNATHSVSATFNYWDASGNAADQWVWNASAQLNNLRLSLDEDVPFSDKYNTIAFEIGYRFKGLDNAEIAFGANVITNDSRGALSMPKEEFTSRLWGTNSKGSWRDGQRIESPAYIALNYKGKSYRAGVDSPYIQDALQNGFHNWFTKNASNSNTPFFPTDYSTPSKLYLYNGLYSPYSVY